MTKKEFLEKYPIKFDNFLEELVFFELMDKLYLEFTKEQVLELMNDFYINADDIFNSIKEEKEEAINTLKELLTQALDKIDSLEETINGKNGIKARLEVLEN